MPLPDRTIVEGRTAKADPVSPQASSLLAPQPVSGTDSALDAMPHDLKGKTTRGALVSALSQGAIFFLRTGSMVVLARLLAPADFGIVGMVTACTGFLEMFRDMGLSVATIQRLSITRGQTSTLFWINFAVGCMLALLCATAAPLLVRFYHEPRLFWPTIALATGFVFNGAAVQHRAIMARDMRFAVLASIEVISVAVSLVVGALMAIAGQGYWALVGMYVSVPLLGLLGVWSVGGWMPGLPQRGAGVRAMLRYGSTLTLKNLIIYLAFNTDKVLLGRVWGAVALGIYGRAYQLISLPTQNLNATIGQVAVPALSRLQNDPLRLRSYFLKGYGLFLSLVLPITIVCALFSEDFILVFLGPKWRAAVPLFRLLAPTIMTLALVNPLNWLLLAIGRPGRSLQIALVTAPVVIAGYVTGLSNGPAGVAAGFSVTTMLLVLPTLLWAIRGTPITFIDIVKVLLRPLLSILVAAAVTFAARKLVDLPAQPLVRLIFANTVFFGVYASLLCLFKEQRAFYAGLIRELGIWPLSTSTDRK
jgi:O-antigen/teichoic acid export membrane protein